MPVYKNDKNGTWYAMIRYKDWTGTNRQRPVSTPAVSTPPRPLPSFPAQVQSAATPRPTQTLTK